MLAKAALMKVEFILEIARKDHRFLNDLSRDPFRTLQESGLDLSPGEMMAVIDVVKGTAASTLAPMLTQLREHWGAVTQEATEAFQARSSQPDAGGAPGGG